MTEPVQSFERHEVIFFCPGTLVDEVSTFEVESWDLKRAVELSKTVTQRYGAKPYGFRFETFRVAPPVKDQLGNELEVAPKRIAWSDGTVFLGGTVETFDQVFERNDSQEEILRSNMRGNGYWTVVVNTNSYKTTRPFTKDDVIVDEEGKIIVRGEDYEEYRAQKAKEFTT